jgi:RNA recognition motif-containing protein
MKYDRSGRSLGEAEVIFEEERAARAALRAYSGKPLDGKTDATCVKTCD